MHNSPAQLEVREQRRVDTLFVVLLAIFCVWVLSFPVFPTQDGPAHKFYGGVLGFQLFGPAYGNAYRVRLPVPPYAAEDYFLALASRIMNVDLGEKLFICLTMITMACGVRACCRRMGQAGSITALFAIPLLFSWPLAMGFMNYALGLGLMLLAFACWLHGASGAWLPWLGFAALIVALTVTHPVPLLMLAALCGWDLLTSATLWKRGERTRGRALYIKAAALAATVGALAYPMLYTDTARSTQDVSHSAFQLHTYVNELLLVGLSPFFRHSPIISWVMLYRVMMWAVLGCAGLVGARELRRHRREGSLTRADCMLLAGGLLFVVIPLMPDKINGALDFFIRMMLLVWIFALFGASQAELSTRARRRTAAAAVLCTTLVLIPAERALRPVSERLAALERCTLPPAGHGLILIDEQKAAQLGGTHSQLAADPYVWSSMVPALGARAVVMNSPWIDSSYLPLAPGLDPALLFNILSSAREREDIDQHDGDLFKILPSERERALYAADYFFVIGSSLSQIELQRDMGSFAARSRCVVQDWYALCTPVQRHG